MFEVGTRFSVERHLGPMVWQAFDSLCSQVDHGLDSDDQSRFEPKITASAELPVDKIRDLGFLMHFSANPMANEALDCGESMVGHQGRHFSCDLTPAALLAHQFDGQVECGEGHVEQLLSFRVNCSDRVGNRRIATSAIGSAAGIDADHIAFAEHSLSWNPVDDLFID